MTRVNKYHRANNEFLAMMIKVSKKPYFEGFQKILEKQKFKFDDKKAYINLNIPMKLILLDSLNINQITCEKCNLEYSMPIAIKFIAECSFCALIDHYYFNNDFELIVETDLSDEEKVNGDVYFSWIYTYDSSQFPTGYLTGFMKLTKIYNDSDLLSSIRTVSVDYTEKELEEMDDKKLMRVVYTTSNSMRIKIKAISLINSIDVLYNIYHGTQEFEKEIIKRFFEIGGHSMSLLTFRLPPFINSGYSEYDKEYLEFKDKLIEEMKLHESRFPYWVETSKKFNKLINDHDESSKIFLNEEPLTSLDISLLVEEAILGNAQAIIELHHNKLLKEIAEVVIDPLARIPFDMRIMILTEFIPEDSFEILFDQILDIEEEAMMIGISVAYHLTKYIKNKYLKDKMINHSFFKYYKEKLDEEEMRRRFNFKIGIE